MPIEVETIYIRGSEEWLGVLELIIFASMVGIGVGLIRVFVEDRPTEWHWLVPIKTIASSIFVSIVTGLMIYDYELSIRIKVALTAILAFVANDIITGLKVISLMLAKDPLGFLKAIRAMLSGQGKSQ